MPLNPDLVETTLLAWEVTFYPGKSVVSNELTMLWASTLQSECVTEDEFKAAAVYLQTTCTFFPKPAEMLSAISAIRAGNARLAEQRYLASLIHAKDKNGRDVVAPYYRVKDGRLLPEGEVNNDALPPASLRALDGSQAPKELEEGKC